MKKRAKELEFISRINRDGSGVKMIDPDYNKMLNSRDDEFNLIGLSMTNKTYVAFNINAYVVKLKAYVPSKKLYISGISEHNPPKL